MRNLAFILFVSLVLIGDTSCLKDNSCQDKTIQSESATITAYAAANGIAGTTHNTGVYYQVVTPGSGPSPTAGSQVSVRYTGKLTNGTVFDSQTTNAVTFPLGNTIPGFQIALQLIQKGGTIKFIIPSSLAYGCEGTGNIPGNSILVFEVQLIDVL